MKPLLIGGCERSGTTFLGSLLGGSPEVIALPEGGLRYNVARYFDFSQPTAPLSDEQVRALVGKLSKSYKFKHFQDSSEQAIESLIGRALSPNATMNELIDVYRRNRKLDKVAEPRVWVEHSPNNLAYAKQLLAAYPEARFIHILRDGRAVYNSVKKVSWGPKTPIKASQWWLSKLSFCFAAELQFPDRIHRVKYEDLLTRPEQALREICAFANIPFSEGMIRGDDKFVADYTKQQHAHVGQGIVASRSDSWKTELTKEEITYFEKYSWKMLDMLDYDVTQRKTWPGVSNRKKSMFFLTEAYHSLYLNPKKNRARRKL